MNKMQQLAKLIREEIEGIKSQEGTPNEIIILLNEILKDAEHLANEILKDVA